MIPLGRNALDAACALALFVFAAALAVWAGAESGRSGVNPDFYQRGFAPAVMFACGEGFHNVDAGNSPALNAFLRRKRPSLECRELDRGLAVAPLDYFQRITLYLEWAVALTWRVRGVSWDSLSALSALLAGFYGAAIYGVMRLGMRPVLATIVSAVVVSSPLHLTYVPHLRDYSKAPFLVALVLVMGIAVRRALSRRQVIGLSLFGGVIAGVGFGFRTDLLLAVVPFLVTLFVFRTGPLALRTRLIEGAFASAIFLAAFALTAAPVLSRYARGGTVAHVILLGFGGSFTTDLGVEAKHYELAGPYSDWYQEAVVRSYASRLTGDAHLFSLFSEEYDRASSRYLLNVIATFPADVTVRAFSAVGRVLNAPFSGLARATEWLNRPSAKRMYGRRADVFQRASLLGLAASAVIIAGAAAWSVRRAAFLVFILVFLAGGAAIQFNPRHYFYLEFMAWWAIGACVDRAVAAGRAVPHIVSTREWRTREHVARVGAAVARSAALVVAVILASSVMLGATRRHQQQRVNALFERALAAPNQPLSVTTVPGSADRVTLTVDLPELELDPESWERRSIGTAYLLIDVNPQRCDAWSFSARVRYEAGLNGTELLVPVTVPLVDPQLGSSVKILVPVYAAWFPRFGRHKSQFAGLDLPGRDAPCIVSIGKLGDLGALPLLVTAILGPDWRTASHYQTMTGIEPREDGIAWHARFYPMLTTLGIPRSVTLQPTTDVWHGAGFTSRVAAQAPPFGMTVDGIPETDYSYLLQSRERAISRGTCAVADGELTAGGLTFGMLRNGQWYQQVNISDRGRFVAAGCAQDDGTYGIVLANDNPGGRVTTARLTRIGWVMPEGTTKRD